MEDIAMLGLAVESSSVPTAEQRLVKLATTAAATERSTQSLTAATRGLDAAQTSVAASTDKAAAVIARSTRTYDAADAAYRKAMAGLTAAANAEAAAMRTAGSEVTRQYASMTSAAQRYAAEMSRTVDKIKVADAYQASLKAAQRTIADTAKGTAAAVAATGVTWKQFVADRMGDYMRLEGSHGAAMTRIGAEWQAYKQTLTGTAVAAENASKRIVAATATTQRAVGYMGTPGQVGLNAQQRVMLGYQLQDVFTSLASGMNPAIVAAQQGPQISMLYGGFRNMLGAIPKPLLVGGGIAAGVGAGIYGLNSAAESQDARLLQDRRFGSLFGADGAGTMRDIRTMASSVSVGVDEATQSVEGFAKATRGLAASRQDIIGITAEVEKLVKLGGANDNEASAAREGVAGMLKASTVSADQLKTVLANVPGIAKEIAAGLGVSVTQLRLMTDQGDLTNRRVLDAMLQRTGAVNEQFAAMPKSVGDLFSSIGTDLAGALKNLADSIPLVNQYRAALELAAKAAKGLKEAGTPESNASIIARTTDAFRAGPVSVGAYQFSRSTGTAAAQRDFYAAQFDAAAQEVDKWAASVRAAVKSADEGLVAAASVARKFDPLSAAYRDNQRDIDAMEKALGTLQAGLTNLSGEEAARQIDVLTRALQRAREEASNIDPALKAINDLNRRNEFRANDNTPAGMALQSRVRELDPAGTNQQNAITAAYAEQQEKIADIIKAKQDEAAASDKITAAMGRGKKALIEAQVEAAVLAFIMANVGKNTEQFAAEIQSFRDAVKTIFTNESIQGGVNASKPLLDELAGITAAMKVVEQGAYAMKRAEAEARAARDENGTGGLQMEVFDARQALTDATTLDSLKQEIDLTNDLAVAAGNVAEQKRIQLDYDIKRAQQNASPSNAEKLAAEMRAKAAADTRRETAEGAAEIERQVELTKQQAEIVRSGNADYAAQLAMLQKKNDLLARGVDIASEEAQRQITGAGNLARANVELDRAKEAADATKRIWMNAYDGIQSYGADVFFDIFRGAAVDGKSVADSLKNIFLRAFAEIAAAAVIRPIIAPIFSAVGSMFGGGASMPAAVGMPGTGSGGFSMPSFGGFGGGGLSGFTLPSWLGGGQPFSFLSQPIGGFGGSMMTSASSPASLVGPVGASGASLGGITWGQGLGALGGIGMGAYQLLSGKGSTSSTIGGIASMVGGAVSLIPGIGQIAGPIISILGSVLPGLFEAPPEPPTMRASQALNFRGGQFVSSGGAYGGASDINLGGIGGSMKALLDAAGVTLQDAPYGLMQQTYSKGDFSNATTFVNGRQWGQSSDPQQQQQALDTAGAHVAHQIMLEVGSGISDLMREGLSNYGAANLDYAFSTKELGEAVAKLTALEDAMKEFGKTTTDAEAAIKAIDDSFQPLFDTAAEFKINADEAAKIAAERDRQRLKATEDFSYGIIQGILGFEDPLQAALNDLDKQRQKDVENNAAYVRLVAGYQDQAASIDKLYYLQRNKLIEESNAEATAAQERAAEAARASVESLQDVIRRLQYGDLSTASPDRSLSGTSAAFNAALAQSRAGDETATANLAGFASAYAESLKAYYGSSAGFQTGNEYIQRQLQERMGALGTVAANGTPAVSSAQTNAVLQSNAELRQMVSDLLSRLASTEQKLADATQALRRAA